VNICKAPFLQVRWLPVASCFKASRSGTSQWTACVGGGCRSSEVAVWFQAWTALASSWRAAALRSRTRCPNSARPKPFSKKVSSLARRLLFGSSMNSLINLQTTARQRRTFSMAMRRLGGTKHTERR
jgi:hypothetical protein